jgi:hypothetical protein
MVLASSPSFDALPPNNQIHHSSLHHSLNPTFSQDGHSNNSKPSIHLLMLIGSYISFGSRRLHWKIFSHVHINEVAEKLHNNNLRETPQQQFEGNMTRMRVVLTL